jgi:ubiquinol-cytochrome c reductase cytochrome b subunit
VRRVIEFLRERAAIRDTGAPSVIHGGASFAYVFGSVLVFLLLLQALTGLALAAFYSPSSTDAWGSVAYIQDQAAGGWIVRGLHYHGAGALVVVAGIHLVQTAIAGAYKRPRELVWWLGLGLLLLVLAWAVTGYVLRWDQAGYWANRVEIGIAAGTPIVGDTIKELALGGNDYGNLTVTRFYMLHVALLPVVVTIVTIAHIVVARRHGTTPVRERRKPVPRWPNQAVLDAAAMAIALAVLLAVVVRSGGADLAAPADPSQAYDARPLWYFRWLFELRELSGSAEKIVAMVAPAIVGGFLVALPLLDKGPERAARTRVLWLGALAGLLAVITGLSVMSLARDDRDEDLAKRQAEAETLATRARALAKEYGVPATGGAEIWSVAPMWKGRTLFAKMCAGCHDPASAPADRIGPIIRPGHGNRDWIRAFLKAPNGPDFWGRTKLAKDEVASMKAFTIEQPDQDAIVELLYAQSGAADVDPAKVKRGVDVFGNLCDSCHSIEEGVAGTSAPGLFGLHGRAFYLSFIGNPKLPLHMGTDKSEMPRFDSDLSVVDRDAIAEYLVWLRSATQADLDKLGPL